MNYLNINKNFLNIFFFLYLISYISGPAIINIFITLLSLFCLIYCIINSSYFIKNFFSDKSLFLFIIFYFFILVKELITPSFNLEIIVFFRFIIIFLFLSIYLKKINFNFRFNYKLLGLILFLISLDTLFQYVTGFNLLGFEKFQHDRLTGVFDDEPILGSFLFKILIIYSVYIFTQKSKSIFSFSAIFLCFIAIFLSGERMPFLQTLLCFSIIFIFIIKPNLKTFIFVLFLFTFFISLIFTQSTNIKSRYLSTINGFQTLYYDLKSNKSEFDHRSKHGIHDYYLNFGSGINLWQKNLLFGNGYRNYKNHCYENVSEKFKRGCSTHPHNIYIELLADHGLFGLMLYLIFLIRLYYEFYRNSLLFEFRGFLLTSFVISIPFVTSQSIFSSYYGSIYFLFIFMIKILVYKKN